MSKAPFAIDPVLTGITLAYKNLSLIADSVLPRITPPLDKEVFNYTAWTQAEAYTIPNTKVGRKSAPNEIEFTGTESTSQTDDYGLDDVIPWTDTANAGITFDPRARAVVTLSDLIALDREVRVAALLFATGSYASGQSATLSGTSQWSDFTNSNPL